MLVLVKYVIVISSLFYFSYKLLLSVVKRDKFELKLINAPKLIPFFGNIHLFMSLKNVYNNFWSLILKYSTPLRVKCLTYEAFIIDAPADIRQLLSTQKAELYKVINYNNGLFSIDGV